MSNNINLLNIGATPAYDDSIKKIEYYTYTPYTNSFNESEEIRIAIQNQDLCLLPCESYIYMQITVTTKDYVKATSNKIKFIKNFASFLFSNARYELNGVEIDSIRNVGITSTLKQLVATSSSNTVGYHRFNEKFTDKEVENDATIIYDVMLPLKMWFGFCDDYRKIILNSRHELILQRARNQENCVWDGLETGGATVTLAVSKIEWKMPYVTLSDSVKMNMHKFMQNNKRLPIQYRSWDLYEYPDLPQTTDHIWAVKTVTHLNKPRYVFVAFQHDKMNKKNADASSFFMKDIKSLRLHLNSQVYPYKMHDLDVGTARMSELYEAYANIQSSYYNGAENVNQFMMGFRAFQENPVFTFDISRSDESVKNGTVDIRLEIMAKENLKAKTTAYCLIIYDNEFEYSPMDGFVGRRV